MTDRILRDEIWQSDRFLDLATDTQRLAFIRLLSMADDFGNLEGHITRMRRQFEQCLHIKTDADALKVLAALVDVDLIRHYQVEGREFWHIPRFRSHRQYLSRKCPQSPFESDSKPLGKDKRKEYQALSEKVATTSQPSGNSVAGGVGVGVGVGDGVGVGVGESINSLLPPTTIAAAPRAKARRAVGMAIPDFTGENEADIGKDCRCLLAKDFDIPLEWGTDAEALGWKREQVIREAERMKQWFTTGKGQGTRRTVRGWRASWQGWLRRAEK